MGAGLLGSALALGLRHGFDVDHLAAIGDIAGAERSPRRALGLSTVYALAHGAVVLVLGIVAVVGGSYVPPSLDEVLGRIAGLTLLMMGAYVLLGLVRHGTAFRVRSRWSLVLEGLAAVRGRLRDGAAVVEFAHDHPHDHRRPHGHDHATDEVRAEAQQGATVVGHRHPHRHRGVLPGAGYGWRASAGVGIVHGLGAETPTQVVLFVAAAGAGGVAAGLSVLGSFVVGLLLANTTVAAVAAAGVRTNAGRTALAGLAGVFSLVVGTLLLLG